MKVTGRVRGKVALVSGAARGMGAAHARRLVEEGARVVVADLLDKEGEALVAELGDDARYVHLDVTDYDAWQAAVHVAVETFGGLDVLVNNAGIANSAPIEDYSVDAWHSILAVNLTGTFYGIKAAIAPLRTGGRGSIVNISSTAGIKSYGHMAGYTASKFGVRGLTKAAALDLGRYGIRVNSVHPGGIRTPMTEGVTVQEHLALGRLGEPEELAEVVVFLASDESSYATGTEFVIDGGETAGQTRST
ncbi:glucose 1-dehydrogenase [Streptomyces sp. NPDC004044]